MEQEGGFFNLPVQHQEGAKCDPPFQEFTVRGSRLTGGTLATSGQWTVRLGDATYVLVKAGTGRVRDKWNERDKPCPIGPNISFQEPVPPPQSYDDTVSVPSLTKISCKVAGVETEVAPTTDQQQFPDINAVVVVNKGVARVQGFSGQFWTKAEDGVGTISSRAATPTTTLDQRLLARVTGVNVQATDVTATARGTY